MDYDEVDEKAMLEDQRQLLSEKETDEEIAAYITSLDLAIANAKIAGPFEEYIPVWLKVRQEALDRVRNASVAQ